MKYQLLLLLLFCSVSNILLAQTETIREESWGVEFKIQEGWQYKVNEEGYLMGSNTVPGLMMVLPGSFTTREELLQEANQGIQDNEGAFLQLTGDLSDYKNKGLAGFYAGILEWEKVEAYAIGLLNTKGGKGITCIIITTPDQFSNKHIEQVQLLANSFTFFIPEVPNVVKEWQDWFKEPGGCRLKYLTSSGGADYGGGYSSSSSEETIDLCPTGYFSFSSSSSSTFDINAGFGSANSGDQGDGTWAIDFNDTNAVLVLSCNDGRELNYELTFEDNKTYLDGYRYFVLFDDQGPQCY